jgi:hypothetical protein
MAINPNVDFSSGAVLTAAQQNRFPRGIVAFNEETVTTNVGAVETTQITASAFTAVANRYYKISYYEPAASPAAGAGNLITFRLKNGATVLQNGTIQQSGSTAVAETILTQLIITFAAGSVTITATAQGTASSFCYRGADQKAQLIIEDIGPS